MEYLQQLTHATKLEKLDSLKQLAFIQEKTGQKPSTIIVLSLAVLVLFALLFDISTFVISVVCCLVPAFESFLALESPAEDDDIKYLTYWIVFSLSQVSRPILCLFLNPFFYMLLRIVFTITLLHPKIELSLKIYNNYVKPFLESHEKSIDTGLGKVINEGKQILANGASEAIKKIV